MAKQPKIRTDDRESFTVHARYFELAPAAPGLWHEHHNETGAPAHRLQIQDAGLHAYLRTQNLQRAPVATARARAA